MPNTPNATSHTNCAHPATKAARAKCRRDRAKGDEVVAILKSEGGLSPVRETLDPFDLLPDPDVDWGTSFAEDAKNWGLPTIEVEDDWADPDSFYGTGDDSGPGYADLLD